MRRHRLFFLSLIIITLSSTALKAQNTQPAATDCEQILIQADDEFNAGRYYGIPSLLQNCLDKGNFSNEQQVRAYLLLAQAYLILDDPIAADDSYLKLLKADPEFEASMSQHPIDIYYLSKKFIATPIFTPHVRIGLNTSLPRTIYDINTSGTTLTGNDVLKVGVQAGIGVDWNIDTHWSLCIEGNYAYKAFKQDNEYFFDLDQQSIVEKQNWLDIPMYIKYADDSGKIRPFGYAGFAVNLLWSARGPDWLLKNNNSDGKGSAQEANGNAEVLTPKRNLFNTSLVFGGGVKYKIGKDFVYADLRYMAGLTNLTNLENNYYDDKGNFDPAVAKYAQASDIFRLDNVSISFGYIHPIYNPRKKSKPRLGTLFKKKKEVGKDETP
jgi:hypothetical protein